MAGLLDMQGMQQQAAQRGLIGLMLGIGQASAPSPVPRSMLGALAAGGASGLSQYDEALNNSLKRGLLGAQVGKLEEEAQQKQRMIQLAQTLPPEQRTRLLMSIGGVNPDQVQGNVPTKFGYGSDGTINPNYLRSYAQEKTVDAGADALKSAAGSFNLGPGEQRITPPLAGSLFSSMFSGAAPPFATGQVAQNNNRPPAPVVNVNNAGETAFAKEWGQVGAKEAGTIMPAADKARERLALLGRMQQTRDALQAAGGDVSKLAGVQAQVGGLLQALNVDPATLGLPKDAGPAEQLQALTGRLAVAQIGPGGFPANNFSEADRSFIVDIQPKLTDTSTGFEAKRFMEEKLAKRVLEREAMWLRYQDDARERGVSAESAWLRFQTDWSKHARANPVFSEKDKSDVLNLGRPPAAAPGGKASPGVTRQYIWRDGKLVRE